MGIPLTRQLTALLLALACGGLCGVVYDCIRLSRVILGVAEYTNAGRKLYSIPLFGIGSVYRPGGGELRRRIHGVIIAVGDVLFGVLAGSVFSVFLYYAASGCFRWFYLLGWGIGFLVYYFTVGRLTMLSSEVIVYLLRVCVGYVFYLAALPIRLLARMARWIGRRMYQRVILPLAERIYVRRCRAYTKRIQADLHIQIRLSEKGADSFAKLEK